MRIAWSSVLLVALLAGCPTDGDDGAGAGPDEPTAVDWTGGLPPLADEIAHPRGFLPLRTVTHFHTPFSHDACDGHGYVDGALDEECLADMRYGLCHTAIDVLYVSDHPAYAAYQTIEDWLLVRDADEVIEIAGEPRANRIACDSGHDVIYVPGIEDELMPLSLDRHAAPVGDEADALYNASGEDTFAALDAAGARVFQAHPESRSRETMEQRQDWGLTGTEVFNLHVMLGPDHRQDYLGLDPFGWLEDAAPFLDDDQTGEPDLMFIAFYLEQEPMIDHWDALLQRGPMVGIGANDSHQNAVPLELRDGERGDSYRRTLRWFSNVALATDRTVEAADEALAEGRMYVAFEILGTPDGLSFWYEGTTRDVEMGGSCDGCAGGTLHLSCPAVSASSPQDGEHAAEVTAVVYRDGEVWQTGCGDFLAEGPGVYRARIDIVPHHLIPHLGDDPEPFLVPRPWVYTNAIRVMP